MSVPETSIPAPRPAYVAEVAERVYEELFLRLPDSRDLAACRRYLDGFELPTVEELEQAEGGR